MKQAYLTIDDSPTRQTDDLTDYLAAKNVPAILFCIGGDYEDSGIACQGMETLFDPIVRAIEKGFVIGNHSYRHKPAGDMRFEEWKEDFDKTEQLIDMAYEKAGVKRHGYYYRFPYLDRGDGIRIERFFADCERNLEMPGIIPNSVLRLQDYLKDKNFSQPFKNVEHPIYREGVFAGAADSLLTYTTADWMLNPAFKDMSADWPYKSVEDLKRKMDQDAWLQKGSGNHVIIMHDHEGLMDVTAALTEHMLQSGFEFREIE